MTVDFSKIRRDLEPLDEKTQKSLDSACERILLAENYHSKIEGFVIRLPNAIPDGECWVSSSSGDPGRTGIIERATVFVSLALAEKKLKELLKKYPSRTFEIESAPENSRGAIAGENFLII